MSDPVAALEEASLDAWSDPIRGAGEVAARILDLCNGDWTRVGLPAVREVRRRRADSPFILAATEAADAGNAAVVRAALEEFMVALDDQSWASALARDVSGSAALGVTSLGPNTLAVLNAGREVGVAWESLVTDRRAIARGLGYLRFPIRDLAPEHADTMLVAAAAAHGRRVWVTNEIADAVLRAHLHHTDVVPVIHPLTQLSTANRRAYRPEATLIDVEL